MNIQSIFTCIAFCVCMSGCLFSSDANNDGNNQTNNDTNNDTNNLTSGTNNSTNNVTTAATCGDGIINQETEFCDTNAFVASETCSTYEGDGSTGTLLCGPDCVVVRSQCSAPTPVCGNGNLEMGEGCDPSENEVPQECGENFVGAESCTAECEISRVDCSPIYQQITSGGLHTCGLRPDGSVRCWGDDEKSQLTPPAGVLFKKISAGGWHTCGITDQDNLRCWGGRLAGGGQANPPDGDFTEVSAGLGFTCAISTVPSISCWGNVPPGGPDYTSIVAPDYISTGRTHACAMYSAGSICWGEGPGHVEFARFQELSAGDGYTCFLTNQGLAQCWGRASDTEQGAVATGFPTEKTFVSIDTGRFHACGIQTTDSTPFCWGTPALLGIAPSVSLTQISMGDFHSCGLDREGRAYCWGTPNNSFRLGQTEVPTD